MFCAYPRPIYQVSVYRTIGPLVFIGRGSLLCNYIQLAYFSNPLCAVLDVPIPFHPTGMEHHIQVLDAKLYNFNGSVLGHYAGGGLV